MYLCGMRYKVIGSLGEGGFGSVYLAEDTLLGSTWAIKEVGDCDKISLSAVRAEISVLSRVSHPRIVRITDVFRSDGRIYLVMDHIKGMNLREVIRSKKKIPEKVLFRWCREICEAVSYLHHMDPPVILRDLKPQNIMVRPDGHIVLIDFGAAIPGTTKEQPIFGSRKYAAPEQLSEGKAGIRSDVYSLGRIMEEIAGKDKPFGLSVVIRRCTMKDARLRYRSVSAVQRDIVLTANLGKLMLLSAAVLVTWILITVKAGEKAAEVNKASDARQSYEQGLLCFYELDDYKAMEKYFADVPEEDYPEMKYYTEMSEILEGEGESGRLEKVLESFEEYNESVVSEEDRDRYIKNAFCMAKVWIASGGEKGYEEAFRLGKRVLEISRNEPDDCGSYEADSLRLMINVSILEGRADKNLTDEKYHEAIALIDELTALPCVSTDTGTVIAKRMDEAALYTELGEYENAVRIYEDAENNYPFDPDINYFAHLSLLMQSGGNTGRIRALWDMIQQVDGIQNDKDYGVMKERVESLG